MQLVDEPRSTTKPKIKKSREKGVGQTLASIAQLAARGADLIASIATSRVILHAAGGDTDFGRDANRLPADRTVGVGRSKGITRLRSDSLPIGNMLEAQIGAFLVQSHKEATVIDAGHIRFEDT